MMVKWEAVGHANLVNKTLRIRIKDSYFYVPLPQRPMEQEWDKAQRTLDEIKCEGGDKFGRR